MDNKDEEELPLLTDEELNEAFLAEFEDWTDEEEVPRTIFLSNLPRWEDGGVLIGISKGHDSENSKLEELCISLDYEQVQELHDVLCKWLDLREMGNDDSLERN